MPADEIVGAITRANLIGPSGNMPVAGKYPTVPLNSVVKEIKDLESVPIRTGTYPTVFIGYVGTVTEGSNIVTSYALVTFAKRSRTGSAADAAAIDRAQSGATIAMLPLAVGLSAGGERTAPLGRAVVGGLPAATPAALLVLRAWFAIIRGGAHRHTTSLDPDRQT